jgi:hypothetical protein
MISLDLSVFLLASLDVVGKYLLDLFEGDVLFWVGSGEKELAVAQLVDFCVDKFLDLFD